MIMKIRKDDVVRLVKCEPQAIGRVIHLSTNGGVLVEWQDGIVVEHELSELRPVRLEEISTSWVSF